MPKATVYDAVKNFKLKKATRGRKAGWRKTTAAEDKTLLQTFHKVRKPAGSLLHSRDVWNALPDSLRRKICLRTVRERLRAKGFQMDDKKAGDDKGDAWRKRRLGFCSKHVRRSPAQWAQHVQAVCDFRYFTFYPRALKQRHKVKSCTRTIMSKAERKKPAFLKPRGRIFERKEYNKHARKAKVFGMTTSTGQSLVIPSVLHPTSEHWVNMFRAHVPAFLYKAFPGRSSFTILMDGEGIFHTDEAKAAMREFGVRVLPGWPAHSPDLNPQENVWAWSEEALRKSENASDEFSTFKRRVLQVCKSYPGGEKLCPRWLGLWHCASSGKAPTSASDGWLLFVCVVSLEAPHRTFCQRTKVHKGRARFARTAR